MLKERKGEGEGEGREKEERGREGKGGEEWKETPNICGPFVNSEITKKAQKEKCGTKQTMKRTLLHKRELKKEGRISPCSNSAGNMDIKWYKFFTALHMSTTKTTKVPWLLILGLQTNLNELVNLQIWIHGNNDDQLCVCIYIHICKHRT